MARRPGAPQNPREEAGATPAALGMTDLTGHKGHCVMIKNSIHQKDIKI